MGVGTACTLYEPLVVLEALALTASITISLTLYTFWAARKGLTFQKWGPMLFTCAPLWSLSGLAPVHSSVLCLYDTSPSYGVTSQDGRPMLSRCVPWSV